MKKNAFCNLKKRNSLLLVWLCISKMICKEGKFCKILNHLKWKRIGKVFDDRLMFDDKHIYLSDSSATKIA